MVGLDVICLELVHLRDSLAQASGSVLPSSSNHAVQGGNRVRVARGVIHTGRFKMSASLIQMVSNP